MTHHCYINIYSYQNKKKTDYINCKHIRSRVSRYVQLYKINKGIRTIQVTINGTRDTCLIFDGGKE